MHKINDEQSFLNINNAEQSFFDKMIPSIRVNLAWVF